MDVLTFIAELVKALVWPLTLAIIALAFRGELKSLLSLLRKLKAGPVEAEFEKATEAVLKDAEIAVPPALQGASSEFKNTALKLLKISPRAAIIHAWQTIEASLRRRADQLSPIVVSSTTFSPSRADAIRLVAKHGNLNPDQVALLYELRNLRNEAVHGEPKLSVESALNYIEAASRLHRALEPGVEMNAQAAEER